MTDLERLAHVTVSHMKPECRDAFRKFAARGGQEQWAGTFINREIVDVIDGDLVVNQLGAKVLKFINEGV